MKEYWCRFTHFVRERVDKNDNVVYNGGMNEKVLKFDAEAINDLHIALDHLNEIARMTTQEPGYFHCENMAERLRTVNSCIDKLIKYCNDEPKDYWYIDDIGVVFKTLDLNTRSDKIRKASGNYYGSVEEAKEKLEYLLGED